MRKIILLFFIAAATMASAQIKPQTLGQKPLQITLKSPLEGRVALQHSWEGATALQIEAKNPSTKWPSATVPKG